MKKGFLKCLALSLVLVSSLQFGSFAAKKNVSNYSYTPKTQFVGIKTNSFYGKYKLNENYLDISNSLTNQIHKLISDKINELGIKVSFDTKATKQKLKINRDGNGFVSTSGKSTINISGIESTINSITKIKFINKEDNIFIYDFSDIINTVNTILAANNAQSSFDSSEIESIKELLTFSLSFEELTEEHLNEIKTSWNYLSMILPEFNPDDMELNLELGKEYLIARNATLGMIIGIYEKA